MILALLLTSLANCGNSSPCVKTLDLQAIQGYTYFDGCNTCTCYGGNCNCTTLACLQGITLETWPQPSPRRPLEPAPSCSDSLWKVVRESIDVLAGVKVRQSVVPTLKAAAEACE